MAFHLFLKSYLPGTEEETSSFFCDKIEFPANLRLRGGDRLVTFQCLK
jgi:hypothetical protein